MNHSDLCWQKIRDFEEARFINAKVCERCKRIPPDVIMPISAYIAVCNQCRTDIYQDMNEAMESRRRIEEEW